jgi:hypothetical protein
MEPDSDTLSFVKRNKTITSDNQEIDFENYVRAPNSNLLVNSFTRGLTPPP